MSTGPEYTQVESPFLEQLSGLGWKIVTGSTEFASATGRDSFRDVNFHWAVILLPPTIVDYVVSHELVHLHEPHHTPEFWLRVERAMPDYERRRKWLAERGGSHLTLLPTQCRER